MLCQRQLCIPKLQNLWVKMSDACARPGMMCAAVMSCGSQEMSRLHACIDLRVEPSGSVMVSRIKSHLMLMTGELSTTKWLLVPELLMACCCGGAGALLWCHYGGVRGWHW